MKLIFYILTITAISLPVLNCSNSDPSQQSRAAEIAAGNPSDNNLRILFRWSGDDFATKQELEARDKIEHLIAERQIGYVIQAGSGMGWMDIIVEVDEKDAARGKIEKIIREISPDAKFTIR